MAVAIALNKQRSSAKDYMGRAWRGIERRVRWRLDALTLPLRMRRIKVGDCLMGGENGLSGAQYARVCGDALRPSTPVSQSPHADLLRRYQEEGEELFSPDVFAGTAYYANAARCIDLMGLYFDARSEREIVRVARRFAENFWKARGGRAPLGNGQSGPDEPVRVKRIKNSPCYQIVDGHHRLAMASVRGDETAPAVVERGEVVTPLQSLLSDVMWLNGRRELYQPVKSPELTNWKLVRRCEDRFAKIRDFLTGRPGGLERGRTFVDIGCSYGWFVAQAAQLGLSGTGVERDPIAAAVGELVYGLTSGQIIRSDCVRFLEERKTPFDFVSCFSVAHHFVMRNGRIKAEEFVRMLDRITEKVLFFETGQGTEEWYARELRGWDPDFIESWLRKETSFREIHRLGPDSDGAPPFAGNFGRMLFACVR